MKLQKLLLKLFSVFMSDKESSSTFFDEMVTEHSSDEMVTETNLTEDIAEPEGLYVTSSSENDTLTINENSSSEDLTSLDLKDESAKINLSDIVAPNSGVEHHKSNDSCDSSAIMYDHREEGLPKSIPLIKDDSNTEQGGDKVILNKGEEKKNSVFSEYNSIDSIVSNLVDLFDELDTLSQKTDDKNVLTMISFVQERILEILSVNGGTIISELSGFQTEMHRTVPFSIVPQNTPIKRIIRNGLSINGKAVIKAVVEV